MKKLPDPSFKVYNSTFDIGMLDFITLGAISHIQGLKNESFTNISSVSLTS